MVYKGAGSYLSLGRRSGFQRSAVKDLKTGGECFAIPSSSCLGKVGEWPLWVMRFLRDCFFCFPSFANNPTCIILLQKPTHDFTSILFYKFLLINFY